MEAEKSDLISEQAEYIYLEIGEGYGFNGPEDLALAIIQDKLDEYANDVSTSQQQTIERLYNSVVNVKNPYSKEKQYHKWVAAENVMDTIIRSAPFQEVKQLLNTTEQ